MQVRVAEGRGCQDRNGRLYKPGEVVDVSAFDPAYLDRLIEAGFLVPGEAPKPEEPQGFTGRVSPSIWTVDPAFLEGFGLAELNVAILERDPNVRPFEDRDEAAAWLSKDFEG